MMDVQTKSTSRSDGSASSKRKPTHRSHAPSLALPKLKKIKRDLLTDVSLNSHECQSEILPLVQKSFHWRTSIQTHEFKRVQSVHNPELTAKYLEKRRDMKSFGYPDSLVADTFAFLPVENYSMVEKVCRIGVRCGNQKVSGLGVSHMAVHLCKHADILSPSRPTPGGKTLLVVKVLKGKVKSVVCRNVGVQLEPTPNFDCHTAKPTTDPSVSLPPHLLFYSLQLYVYEYGDLGVEEFPKQILPYAVVHYNVREPQPMALPVPSIPPHMLAHIPRPSSSSADTTVRLKNEIWKGRLHIKLIGGGHIYIDVSILSHFVPLAITLMSPVKVAHTYPNTNAQLTFLAGLTDIANKPEVPWRDYFFRSFIMKPSGSSEAHFKALVRHISSKQEMAALRLPKEVYLFLLPKCLLASQLGLVQGDNADPVFYCVLMSKVSTIKKHKNKLQKLVGQKTIHKCGKATSWEQLFDDSDDDEKESNHSGKPQLNPVSLGALFEQQRHVHNRLAAMHRAEAYAVFSQCACGKPPHLAPEMQRRRNFDIQRVTESIHVQLSSRHNASKPRFPPGSRIKPKQRISRHARAMPSFSPHGSSESDSDSDSGRPISRRHRKHLSMLDSNKTVEEELSEEELTNEQMEAIIFMRKPATAAIAKSTSSTSVLSRSQPLPKNEDKPEQKPLESPEPFVLQSQPKIIPTEPLEELESGIASPTMEEAPISSPIIIPTEPVLSPKSERKHVEGTASLPKPPEGVSSPKAKPPLSPKPTLGSKKTNPPKSILKKSASTPTKTKEMPELKPKEVSNLKSEEIPNHNSKEVSNLKSKEVPSRHSEEESDLKPKDVSNLKPREVSILKPKEVSNLKPKEVSNLKPEEKSSLKPKEVSNLKSEQMSNLKSKEVSSLKPEETSNLKPEEVSNLKPKEMSNLKTEEMSSLKSKEVPNLKSKEGSYFKSREVPNLKSKEVPNIKSKEVSNLKVKEVLNLKPKDVPSTSPFPVVTMAEEVPSGLPHQNAMGDVDMRIPPCHGNSFSFPFSTVTSTSCTNSNLQLPIQSLNWSQGSWLALDELPPSTKGKQTSFSDLSLPHSPSLSQHDMPTSLDASPPSKSPPSPSPLSPGFDSPPLHSPPSPESSPIAADTESPASPPQSSVPIELRSTPIAIPTVRIKQSDSPCIRSDSFITGFSRPKNTHKSPLKEAENADDMMEFLNSAATSFDSDSPFEDER